MQRVFWVDGRLYQVLVVSDMGEDMTEHVQRFMDSFRLISG